MDWNFFVLAGILLTNINIYPMNIFTHGLGVIFGQSMVFLARITRF